jgi:hypothetical protein
MLDNPLLEWIEDFPTGRTQKESINGSTSDWKEVTPGIPSGSVLGPLLFILFINDLPDGIKSDVYLFADDTKIFRNITDGEDKEILQDDLENLENLSNAWLLKFHPEKCKNMNIARVEKTDEFKYKLSGKNIERVQKEKDIGVTIESELTFESHICEKVNKATSIFGALRREFRYLDKKLFIPLYKTMVRTQLDYATSVWAPYKKKHIYMIENVQKRATKQIPRIKNLSYEERLRKLELPTLSYRR